MGKTDCGARHSKSVAGSFLLLFGAHSCQNELLEIRYKVLPNGVSVSRE